MACIIHGKRETYADIPLPKDLCCIECTKLVYDKVAGKQWVHSGGFHSGKPDVFLCSHCARYKDLHILGYIIGDAIISDYQYSHRPIVSVVDDVLDRLRASILAAITNQLQFRLRTIEKEGLK
jgi:hypothetical protein